MDIDFWHERWKANQIGFHQADYHPALASFWKQLELSKGSKVLVPLCGKSLDMLWLLEQGHLVKGVELSELALDAFFVENQLSCVKTQSTHFTHCRAEELELLCGDFFKLTKEDLAGVSAIYDRASLIALPAPMRAAYASHLTALAFAGTKMMLVALSYPQDQMQGPPFSVEDTEVTAHYAQHWQINRVESKDVLAENARFQQQGISHLKETVYLLERKSL